MAVLCLLLVVFAVLPLTAQDPPSSAQSANTGDAKAEQPANNAASRDRLEVMTKEDPKLTEDEEKQLENELKRKKFRSILRAGSLNNEARTLLPKGARYYVLRMSMTKHRRHLHKRRKDLSDLIVQCASQQNSASAARQFREFYLNEVLDRCVELLDGNFHVRMNAVLVLARLNLTEAEYSKEIPAVPFVPATVPLLQVVQDPNQLDGVKIPAAKGLARIPLAYPGAEQSQLKHQMAQAFIAELNRTGANFWYQMRLVEGLGKSDLLMNNEIPPTPFIIETLAKVLVDTKRHWVVRAEAAKSLGRVNLNNSINTSLIAYQIVRLARDMTDAYNDNRKGYYWKNCYWNAYLSFKPVNRVEQQRRAGLMSKVVTPPHQKTVNDAYRLIVPLVKHVLNSRGARIGDKMTQPLDDWLEQNKPQDLRIAPNLQPLATTQNSDGKTEPSG